MSTDVQLIEVNPATPAPGRAPALDVIFIHGLGGHHVETWQPPSGDTWPQRVANAHPDVQVWSLAYPAKVGQLLSIGEMDQPGTRGLSVLATERMVTKKIGERRPCIFVCHSLGGLLAKRILLDAWAADPRNQRRFRHEGVKAVMFCGTPHRGSAMANVLKWLEWVKNISPTVVMTYLGLDHARLTGLAARCFGKTSALIEELAQNNVDLQHLNEDFGRYYQDRAGSDFMVSVYAETKGMRVKGVPTAVVVPPESADPNLRTGAGIRLNVVAVPEKDHGELVKPASMSEWVVEGVEDLIGRVRGGLRQYQSANKHRQVDDRVDRAWRSALERCSVNVLAQMCIEFKDVLGDCLPTLHDLESALEQAFQTEGGPRALRAHIKEALPRKARGLSIDERCDRDRLYVMLLIQSVALTYRASVQGETMGELVVPDRERQFAVAAAAHIVLGLGVQLTVQPGVVSIDNLIDTAGCADAAACPPGRVPSENPLEDELKRWVGRMSLGEFSPESTADLKASLALQEQREHARPILLDSIGMLGDPALRILVRSLDIGAVDTAADGRPANISPGLWSDLCGQLDNQIVWLNKQSTSVPAIAYPPAQVPAQMPPAETPGPMVQVNITGAVGQSNVSTGGHSPIHAQHVAAAMPADTQSPLSVELFALEMAVCDRPHLQQHLLAISIVVQQRQLTAHAMGVLRIALPELRGAAEGSDDVRAAWRTLCQAVHVHWPESSAFFN